MNKIRCAIYTRKSSEEGLEQDFNSLHAQRDACAAYVLSQASEGWTLLSDIYDDGGISGGTLERPGLQRLLTDIAAKQIDIVVVYKVDRLTRSLLDFSKLVEAFDAAGTSFVSVTQSFNTTTSMGRLTLNMLLSFAQFEREVTAERIRDKIAASKAKGMWMGGTPPLGYEPDGRTLAIVEDHAVLVRDIYRRYLDTGNVRLVAEALTHEGIKSPIRTRTNGATFGGCDFTRGQIHYILTSPIYSGRIGHKGKLYEGQHPAIIDLTMWEAVQATLASHVQGERRTRSPNRSPLAGKIIDHKDEPLVAVHACKPVQSGAPGGKVRYRYYVSRGVQFGHIDPADGIRIPAREIETLVIRQVAALFDDPVEVIAASWLEVQPDRYGPISNHIGLIAARLQVGGAESPLPDLLSQVRVMPNGIEISLSTAAIARLLDVPIAVDAPASLAMKCDTKVQRTGRRMRLVHANGTAATGLEPNPALIKLITQARRWWAMLSEGSATIKELAKSEGVSASWMTWVVRLAFLAPSVVDAILDGRQRANLSATELVATNAVPMMWNEQTARYLGAMA